MSNTALTVASRSEFALFSEDTLIKEALDSVGESIGPGDLIRVKVPTGGGRMWQVEGAAGVESVEKLEGIFVLLQKGGVLWPTMEMKKGSDPVLRTHDLQIAEQVGPIPPDIAKVIEPFRLTPKTFDWAKLCNGNFPDAPFGFGSGKNGHGKRVKEYRRLYLLRPNDLYPMVVNIPSGSLTNFLRWYKQVPNATRRPYYHSVVSLSLEPATSGGDIDFSRVVPRVLFTMSDEDGANVKRQYHDLLARVDKQLSDEPDAD